MFRLRGPAPIADIDGRSIVLAAPAHRDRAEWSAVRAKSRAFLEPFEPEWSADEFSARAWRARMRQWAEDSRSGSAFTFFIRARDGGRLLGGLSVFNVRHGAAESGQIGYWMNEDDAGRGVMPEALALLMPFCFDTLGLRRVEAACIPENRRSARVLEKCGFEYEGLVRSYLRINGVRRDHRLYALVAPLRPAPPPGS